MTAQHDTTLGFDRVTADFMARSVLGETGAIREVQPSDARTLAHMVLAAIRKLDEYEVSEPA